MARVPEALTSLATLLEREHNAAIAADLPLLEEIQMQKRAALDELGPLDANDEVLSVVAEQARANVRLLAQLVELHRAVVAQGGGEPLYGARGRVSITASTRPDIPRLRREL